MNHRTILSRRQFLHRAALASTTAVLGNGTVLRSLAADRLSPPIAVFSKIYQKLKLDFDQAAEMTAAAGLDGIDCPVRPGGEIEPERVADDLPHYAEALRKRKTGMLLLTTDIQSVSAPHTEAVLRTAKQQGLRYYRLGWWRRPDNQPAEKLLAEIKARLKDLAALNRELGLCGVYQNHSPVGKTRYVGGNLAELREMVEDFDPEQIGVAFDLGHALVVHGDDWTPHFEQLKRHVKVAYVKDATKHGTFVPFGAGDIKNTDWLTRLKTMGYHAPFSLHIEFDWSDQGRNQTPAALLQALKTSAGVLRQWEATA